MRKKQCEATITMKWNQGLYLVERNTAEICQALDDVWEKIQSGKSKKYQSQCNIFSSCAGLTGVIKSKSTPPDYNHVSISGNPGFGLTWDSLPPPPNQHNQHECKWTQPVSVLTGFLAPMHATSTCWWKAWKIPANQRTLPSKFWYPDTLYPGFVAPR